MSTSMSSTTNEEFRRLHLQGVSSSRGFSVERVDRHHLRYAEGDRHLLVEVEPGWRDGKDYYLAVYASTLQSWEQPHEAELIGAEKRDEILRRIGDALRFLGTQYVLE